MQGASTINIAASCQENSALSAIANRKRATLAAGIISSSSTSCVAMELSCSAR
jgi:hypothetical protein